MMRGGEVEGAELRERTCRRMNSNAVSLPKREEEVKEKLVLGELINQNE